MKHPGLKEELLRDWYKHRSREYLSEYTRRIKGLYKLTMQQRIDWYEKPKRPTLWTKEHRQAYMLEYNREYRKKNMYKVEKKKRLTMDEMLEKIKKMREQQNIIL